jgi:FKBP-type peptidyl-prolyl cis-trans isomerase SlyD
MQIDRDKVVTLKYTLTNQAGEVLDRSGDGEPLAYLHGQGNIIPGLEEALAGRRAGDKLQVAVPAAKAYGERDSQLIQQVPKRSFQGASEIRAGMRFHAQTDGGPRAVTVVQVQGDMVTVDGNHPLAGQDLHFDVEVEGVRAASDEELTHGHVHGPGGHHHHD